MVIKRDVKADVISAAGGVPKLATALGISRHAIYQWDRIPIERVPAIVKITGISKAKLRPDIFGGAA